MKTLAEKHWEKLNAVLKFIDKNGPVDIHEIWSAEIRVGLTNLKKQLNFRGKKGLIQHLLDDGYIEKMKFNRTSGREGETGFDISNKGINFLVSGGYKNNTNDDNGTEFKNHFCKSMNLEIPKKHFKIFTERNSKKNNQPHLTANQFDLFIERAFCGNTKIQKQKINYTTKEKLRVVNIFRTFYDEYCFDYFGTMQHTDKFIKLLTDNFTGWEFQQIKNCFVKAKNVKTKL